VRKNGKTLEEFGLTTPGQIQLREILYRYGKNCDFAVMEVSSHALDQERVRGLQFESAAWTSFTQDHLDYHKTMDSYFAAKEKLIQYVKTNGHLYVPATQTGLTQRLKHHKNIRTDNHLSSVLESTLPPFFRSHFNRDNLNCAIDLISEIGVDVKNLKFANLVPPPGRFYIREWNNRMAVVDFAHTPDALENILKSIKESFLNKKVTVVFGCGGDRDKTKRPQMGAVARKYADKIILTSDNPRTENPEQIIQDILVGIKDRSNVFYVTDRPSAVKKALEELANDEVLLLAGKGHEDYIIKGTEKIHYSDIEELDNFVRLHKG
jgi:UDP-N-acetylmuramoyl-L-alanyl-D-glutamate--2,6-diaminopimelate ligase